MFRTITMSGLALLALTACSKKDETPPGAGDGTSVEAVAEKGVQALSCGVPVTKDMTAEAILKAFPGNAKKEAVPGPEGSTENAVVIYPNDPARKVIVTFWDEAQTKVADVSIGDEAVQWYGPGNIRVGSPLKDVEAANGGPLTVYGFEWDYGGYASDFQGGKLNTLDGGCVLSLRFSPPKGHNEALTSDIVGDQQIPSTNANLQALQPVVSRLSVGWPSPEAATANPQ
ncbi:hypothetical protein PQU92_03800 [Asticcacaulis sp. BYS171W]|uniref:Lipoprotein n=1 Tax=Asticcacaulis aquaticus TaxID=2984212 RepID=A0ABT5HQP8_9CAUL|nr:hypothetical protein [Asticcacaulis aquaticus]MDC7682384.1 hypothetical protein [Asticcacaulis aquaticus]